MVIRQEMSGPTGYNTANMALADLNGTNWMGTTLENFVKF